MSDEYRLFETREYFVTNFPIIQKPVNESFHDGGAYHLKTSLIEIYVMGILVPNPFYTTGLFTPSARIKGEEYSKPCQTFKT